MSTLKTTTEKTLNKEVMNILIVDDRPENLLTLESIIEQNGRRIIKADDGNEALRIAIRENIGLIMLDIQMPEIDGIEVARLLRSNKTTRHIPIIFVSAMNNLERPCMDDFERGTVDCLHKPLDMDETRNKVALYEKIYHMRNEGLQYKAAYEKSAMQFEQFVYIVAHDLKAPLRAIDNLTNWISDDLGNTQQESVTENLSLMKTRVNRMRALLEGVLEFSRSGKYEEAPESVDLSTLSHAIFESLTPGNGFALHAQGLPTIQIENARMYTVLFHLIKNAVVHHNNPGQGIITINCEEKEGKVIISVSDNGPGIKPQYAQKIFEVFSTLKSKDDVETTGIGLPIARKVLEEIGEKIWLDTEHNNGTQFKFTLPA